MRMTTGRWAVGIAAVVASAFHARHAAAAFAYGYGQQTVNSLSVTGPSLANMLVTGSNTTASAVAGGSGVATNGVTDAAEAYQLSSPPAPQNSFVKYSTTGGGPQAGDFTRGDVLLGNVANLFTSGANTALVSESYASGTNGLETAASTWQISGTFTSSGSSVTVGYNYANDIITQIGGTTLAPADAQFGLTVSIKDQHGHEIDASPSELNTVFTAPPNGPEVISSGSGSAIMSLTGLTAGDTYAITIGGLTHTAAGTTVVPEPASFGLLAVAAALGARRRR